MKQRLLRFMLGLALALPTGLLGPDWTTAPAAQTGPAAPGEPVALQGAEEIYYVEWNITAHGETDETAYGARTITRRAIQIAGSAVVHKPPEGFLNTIPFQLTVTDDFYQVETTLCYEDHDWWTITDSGRYNGGPDEFWVYPATFWPQQRPDGTWYMDNPFSDLEFTINGQLGRDFNYRFDHKYVDLCGANDSSDTMTMPFGYYSGILFPVRNMPLEGDPTGTTFSLSESYVMDYMFPPLTVDFRATVRVGSCKDLAGPIDISSPYIRSLELHLEARDTVPDSVALLQAAVTCQGVPVKNAPVEVTLNVAEGSGGHRHGDSQRPRGYINGEEITAENPSLTDTTGNDGQVAFFIGPGRDLKNKTRGIAGWYIVDAQVLQAGYEPAPEASAGIHAHLSLVSVPDGPDYVLARSARYKHGEPFYGTPEMAQLIYGAAGLWRVMQEDHNQDLSLEGKPAWPLVPLDIFAVSLEDGGLYDLDFGAEWRPPFNEHRTGTDVQLLPAIGELSFPGVDPAQAYAWLRREFWQLGKLYGTWFYDGGLPYNLRFSQDVALPQTPLFLAARERASTTPDIAAVAMLLDSEGRFVAGAGQTVTYTVGVENVLPDTQANDVVLSGTLPAGLNFASANPPPTSMADARTPVWAIGDLPAEAVPTVFNVVAQVDPSVAAGTVLTVSATATTSSADADPANNQFDAWGLTVQPPGPDLVIRSDLGGTALTVGEPVTFTVRLSNDGNAPAPGSWLQLTLPPSLTITSAVPPTSTTLVNGVRWDAGTLAPGAGQTFTVTLHVDAGLLDLSGLMANDEPQYPLGFSLTAGSTAADIDPASNQLQVNRRVVLPGADLVLGLHADGTPGPGTFAVGQEVTYTLRYANFGNRTAEMASATLLLWNGLEPLAMQPAPGQTDTDPTTGATTLTWNLGDLAVGDAGAIQVRLRVDAVPAEGSIILASLSSSTRDLNPADNAVMEIRSAAPAGAWMVFLPMVMK